MYGIRFDEPDRCLQAIRFIRFDEPVRCLQELRRHRFHRSVYWQKLGLGILNWQALFFCLKYLVYKKILKLILIYRLTVKNDHFYICLILYQGINLYY